MPTTSVARTNQTDLDSPSGPGEIPNSLKNIQFGTVLAQFSAPRLRSALTTPAVVEATTTATFPRPVIVIVEAFATVNAKALPVVLGPTAIEGTTPSPHTAVPTFDAAGRITVLTFSGNVSLATFRVIEDNTTLAEHLAANPDVL